MLSVGKVTDGMQTYHLEQVAAYAEEYYSGRGEAEGEWIGVEMEAYGLGGKVRPKEFLRMVQGEQNDAAKTPFARSFSRREILAFDLTFSAPKSVSLMYAAGEDHIKQAVVEAHDVAVRAGYSYMEGVANWGRARKDGELHAFQGKGLVGAAFRHRTNRLGEPNLHSHVVTPNMIQIGEQQWTTLDAKRIYNHAKAGGTIYQSALRRELTRRLGVTWGPVTKGQADIEGITRDVIERFSSRRDEIEASMFESGHASTSAAQAAALRTRLPKAASKVREDMFEGWSGLLEATGLSPEFINSLCGREARISNVTRAQERAIYQELEDSGVLTAQRAYTDRRRVIEALSDLAPATASPAELERLADTWIAERGIVISEQGHGPVDDVKKLIAAGNRAITTSGQIAIEDAVIAEILDRAGNGAGRVDERVLAHGMKVHAKALSDEQRQMVEHVLTSGNGVDVVIGDAGTGKTFALNALRRIYEDAGYTVTGAALAARAARELGEGAEVSSETVHRTLRLLDVDFAVKGSDPAKTVLLIDEAGMLDTGLLSRVLSHARSRGMKIVLIGDDKQLPPIGPGGVLRAVAERLGYARLTENRRQRDAIDQEIVADFRDGRGASALERARLHGRLTLTETHADALDVVYNGWAAEADPSKCLMIAGLRDEVYALNTRAQADRLDRGELGEVDLRCGVYSYRVGDVVRCGARDRAFQVANGDFGRVTAVDIERHEISVELTVSGKATVVTLASDYIDDPEKFKLGYAITAHTAQGATCENAWTLMNDRTYRELAYTQASRARGRTQIVIVGSPVIDLDAPGFDPAHDPTEFDAVVAALRNSQAQAMAVDVGKVAQFAGVSTEDLVLEVAASREQLAARTAEAIDAAACAASEGRTAELDIELAPPAAEAAQRYRDLANEIKLRCEQTVRSQMEAPPRYLTRELGPVPVDPAQREYWRRAALEVELFRCRWDIRDKTDAFSLKSPARSPLADSRHDALKERQRAASFKRMLAQKKAIDAAPIQMKGASL